MTTTRQQLEQENAFLREMVTQYQYVRWLHFHVGGEPIREAYIRLREMEAWAAARGVLFDGKHAPHDAKLPNPEITLTCSCGDRLSVSGGSAAVAAARGYFRMMHGRKKCRVEQAA